MHSRTLSLQVIPAALILGIVFAFPHVSLAADTCTFEKDLTVGADSAQVKCLQQYLNKSGFVIAQSGVGSLGHETTQFKEKTMAAVKEWQVANGITPATGTFGAKSRAKYKELTTATVPPVTPTPPATTTPPVVIPPVPTVDTTAMKSARSALKSALGAYNGASDDYDTAHDDDEDTGQAKTFVQDAKDTLWEAYMAYVNEDYDSATSLANQAKKSAQDASDEIGGSSSTGKDEAKTALDAVKKSYTTVRASVDAANKKGANTNKADRYIQDASSAISDARDSFDSKDYNDALDFVNDAKAALAKAKTAIK